MTPADWQTTDARILSALLDRQIPQGSLHRGVCLFCHGCCSHLLPRNPPPAYLRALERMLEAADGQTDFDDLNRIGQALMRLEDDLTRIITFAQAINLCFAEPPDRAGNLGEIVAGVLEMRGEEQSEVLANIAHDIFDNVFLWVQIDPRWRTGAVLDLARTIDAEFSRPDGDTLRMHILADALMDAGCDNEALLSHCRQPAEHVRGCWVIESLIRTA